MKKPTASEAGRALGSIKSAKKAAASRENAKKRKEKPIESVPCTCGTATEQHKSTCKIYQILYKRARRKKLRELAAISSNNA